MTSPQQVEILDLRHFSGRQLRPLLEEEAAIWHRRLHWDYRSSIELLLQYLDSRILPGFVALTRGRIHGYTFCVYEGQKAVIGDVYAAAEHPTPHAVCQTLTRHLLETLGASPDVDRIEAQLLLFDAGTLPPAFAAAGFQTFPRLFLERALEQNPEQTLSASRDASAALPATIELSRWSPANYDEAAILIQACYVGHIDSEINDQYRSLAGSLRFLHNIVRFPGCGHFDPDASWVVRDRLSNALVALILCSRVAPEVAHVTQLCVAPAARGSHLGQALLHLCMAHLPRLGYRALSLTVTEANTPALRLYQTTGFRTLQRFEALVLTKQPALPQRFRFRPS